jgi:hypothetical protein
MESILINERFKKHQLEEDISKLKENIEELNTSIRVKVAQRDKLKRKIEDIELKIRNSPNYLE